MLLFLTFFILVSYISCAPQMIKDFRSNPMGISKKEGLFEVSLNISENSRVVAYADVNSDKYVDMIVVSTVGTQDNILIYIYNYDSAEFSKQPTNAISVSGRVINVIANDFNQDNRVDLLVSYYSSETNKYITSLFVQNGDSDFLFTINSSLNLPKSNLESSIMVADINGDTIPDILYYSNGTRYFTFLKGNSTVFKNQTFSSVISPLCGESQAKASRAFANPHSSAFLDLDGDCVNDLFLVTTENGVNYAEIWKGKIYNNSVNYCFFQEFKLDPSIGQFSFADIDRNGYLDLVFPISGDVPTIGIAYNQIKVDINWDEDYCSQHLGKDSQIIYKVIDSSTNNFDNQMILILKDLNDYNFVVKPDINLQNIIRVGDINSDSFPDLLITLKHKLNSTTKTYILTNSPQANATDLIIKRTFNSNISNFLDQPNLVYSSFFDLDENGQLDIIAVTYENGQYYTKGYYNNYIYDAFFLKSIHFVTQGIYFTNVFGTTYRYINTNLDGSRRMDTSVQMPQTTNLQLNLPYSYIGIGRSNNYVENFAVISSVRYKNNLNYKIFTPIIPNSQLIISSTPENDDLVWNLDLIVNPISKLSILIITIVSILIIILGFIVYLHIKEVQEDKENESKTFIFWYK